MMEIRLRAVGSERMIPDLTGNFVSFLCCFDEAKGCGETGREMG